MKRERAMAGARAAIAAIGALMLSACAIVTVQPRAFDAADQAGVPNGERLDPADWPERLVRDGAASQGAVLPLGRVRTALFRTGPRPPGALNEATGRAFEAFDEIAPPLPQRRVTISSERVEPREVLVGPVLQFGGDGSVYARTDPSDRGDETFVFVSGVLGELEDGEPVLHLQRTWYQLLEPSADPKPGGEPRGVVVLLPGMFGTPEPIIDRLVRRAQSEGYAVVRFLAHPERFTERVEFELDPGDLEASAAEIARVLTDRAAECAYAVHAALRDAETRRPHWRGVPVAAIGMSGGAMVLPTVIARDPARFDAAIYIAGGADFWRVAQQSNYRLWIDSISWKWLPGIPSGEPGNRPPAAGLVDRLNDLYLERAPLDSLRTALIAARVPTLMIHGSGDLAVPAGLGDELWQALGRPERRVMAVGHEMLFMTLPGQFDEMLDWLAASTDGGE